MRTVKHETTGKVESPQNKQLLHYISRWDRRLRLSLTTLWVPRGILTGLLIGVGAAMYARLRPWLYSNQLGALALAVTLLATVAAVLGVWFWPRPALRAARFFDLRFGLKERSSTALEIAAGGVPSAPDLTDLQLRDAVNAASKVKPARYLPFQWRRRVCWRCC